jgi:hypothetical protein
MSRALAVAIPSRFVTTMAHFIVTVLAISYKVGGGWEGSMAWSYAACSAAPVPSTPGHPNPVDRTNCNYMLLWPRVCPFPRACGVRLGRLRGSF